MRLTFSLLFALFPVAVQAAVVGMNPPAPPLTIERIATLPAEQQPAWRDYLVRSERSLATDARFYAEEIKSAGLKEPLVPPHGGGLKIDHNAPWYGTEEARRVAENLVSFQTPAGGWNKNTDMTVGPRRTGERSGYEAGYIGTFDNDATITPLRFLAHTITASRSPATNSTIRAAFLHGLDYVFAAQFPNGGWPQVWPLEGGYHDMVTFNDGAMVNILTLLQDIAAGRDEFSFVPKELRARAAASFARGLDCILATQIVTAGRRTVWCQQHDPLTLAPTSARNYEMPAQAAGESAGITLFLMTLPTPDGAVVTAVKSAASWFEKTVLHDVQFKPTGDGTGRHLNPVPGATPLWPRYSEIGSDRPLFGDRDKTIHDSVEEISKERRDGYAWYGDTPKRALEHFAAWRKMHGAN